MRILQADNPINWRHPLNSGLVGEWSALPQPHARTGYGTRFWLDLTGRYRGSTVSTVAWTGSAANHNPGAINLAAGPYVLVSSGAILGGLVNLSVFGWINSVAAGVGSGRPVYCERASSGNDILKLEAFNTSVADHKILVTYRNDGGTLMQVAGATSVDDGRWHLIGMTKERDNPGWNIYLDGLRDGGSTFGSSSDAFTNAGIEARIGADKGDGTALWSGLLGGVMLWNRLLLPSEVRSLYLESIRGNQNRYNWITPRTSGFTAAEAATFPGVDDDDFAYQFCEVW